MKTLSFSIFIFLICILELKESMAGRGGNLGPYGQGQSDQRRGSLITNNDHQMSGFGLPYPMKGGDTPTIQQKIDFLIKTKMNKQKKKYKSDKEQQLVDFLNGIKKEIIDAGYNNLNLRKYCTNYIITSKLVIINQLYKHFFDMSQAQPFSSQNVNSNDQVNATYRDGNRLDLGCFFTNYWGFH
uniref:Uncharacterized protein n=1 Tax=Meloidogyne hapla TaxID=6305 RepID=A0A1I8BG71_MELHA